MSENKFKIRPSSDKSASATAGTGGGLFALLERRIRLETYFEEGFPVKNLPKILFVLALGIVYISNSHYSEKAVRQINAIQTEVEDLRADYTTLKADLMFASKQSEVARKVKDYGLEESSTPPFKIVVKEGEY
jgi:hypothetical protein